MRKSKLTKYYNELWHVRRRAPETLLDINDVLKRLEEIEIDLKEREMPKEGMVGSALYEI